MQVLAAGEAPVEKEKAVSGRVNFRKGFRGDREVREAVERVIQLDIMQHLNGVSRLAVTFERRLTDMQTIRQDLTHAVQAYAGLDPKKTLKVLNMVHRVQMKFVSDFSQQEEAQKSWFGWIFQRSGEDVESKFKDAADKVFALFFIPGDIYSVLIVNLLMPFKNAEDEGEWKATAQSIFETLGKDVFAYTAVMTFAFVMPLFQWERFNVPLALFKKGWENLFEIEGISKGEKGGPVIETQAVLGWSEGGDYVGVHLFTKAKEIMKNALIINQFKFEGEENIMKNILKIKQRETDLSLEIAKFGAHVLLYANHNKSEDTSEDEEGDPV
eukprot:413752-Rhodomonas_salina.2